MAAENPSPSHDHVGPDKRCPVCDGFLLHTDKPVVYKCGNAVKEFCSSDCLLDWWEQKEKRGRRSDRR